MKIPAQFDYEEKGHPGVWGPGLEDQRPRDAYDELLAGQAGDLKVSTR
jgi:hypothetical protein